MFIKCCKVLHERKVYKGIHHCVYNFISFILSYPIILSIKLNYSVIKNISLVNDFRAEVFGGIYSCIALYRIYPYIYSYTHVLSG